MLRLRLMFKVVVVVSGFWGCRQPLKSHLCSLSLRSVGGHVFMHGHMGEDQLGHMGHMGVYGMAWHGRAGVEKAKPNLAKPGSATQHLIWSSRSFRHLMTKPWVGQ